MTWITSLDLDLTSPTALDNAGVAGAGGRTQSFATIEQNRGLAFSAFPQQRVIVPVAVAKNLDLRVSASIEVGGEPVRRSILYVPGQLDLHVTSANRVACAVRTQAGWKLVEAPQSLGLALAPDVPLLGSTRLLDVAVEMSREHVVLGLDLGQGWQSWRSDLSSPAPGALGSEVLLGCNPVAHVPLGESTGWIRRVRLEWRPRLPAKLPGGFGGQGTVDLSEFNKVFVRLQQAVEVAGQTFGGTGQTGDGDDSSPTAPSPESVVQLQKALDGLLAEAAQTAGVGAGPASTPLEARLFAVLMSSETRAHVEAALENTDNADQSLLHVARAISAVIEPEERAEILENIDQFRRSL